MIIKRLVDEEDEVVGDFPTSFGVKSTAVINESGIYALVLAFKLLQAKAFMRWVVRTNAMRSASTLTKRIRESRNAIPLEVTGI